MSDAWRMYYKRRSAVLGPLQWLIFLLEITLRTNIANEENEGLNAANSEVRGPSHNTRL